MPYSFGSVYSLHFKVIPPVDHPHPGVIVFNKAGSLNGKSIVGVKALLITHTVPAKNQPNIYIPRDERQLIGLDEYDQWIKLDIYRIAILPNNLESIQGKSYYGKFSSHFTEHILNRYNSL